MRLANRFDAPTGACPQKPLIGAEQTTGLAGGYDLNALCAAERYSDAFEAIVSTSDNSWYNMIREGATTCFEAWGKDKKWNTSLFHPWSVSPAAVLLDGLAGKTDYYKIRNEIRKS